jgi:hypothetical protein
VWEYIGLTISAGSKLSTGTDKLSHHYFPAQEDNISAGSNIPTGIDVSVPVEYIQPVLIL